MWLVVRAPPALPHAFVQRALPLASGGDRSGLFRSAAAEPPRSCAAAAPIQGRSHAVGAFEFYDLHVMATDSGPRVGSQFLILTLFLFTGCLPYSCRPTANEALFPADSTSREVAEAAPADTLHRNWTSQGTDQHPLAYPRTVRFSNDGTLAVSDVERNSLFRFTEDGRLSAELAKGEFHVPYLAGVRKDTFIVFSAETDQIDYVVDGERQPDRAITFDRPAAETLVYTLATENELYAKVTGEGTDPAILRLGQNGTAEAEVSLPGPYWRRAGFLRTWNEHLVSVSGFRPVVHVLPRAFESGVSPDSVRLVGFDSPMLERSYAYSQGDVSNPPLLTASAAAVNDTLFVLNLRPGWVQIDAYDRSGRLERRLVERHSEGNRDFYPLDLDVRRAGNQYLFAVTIRSPEPELRLFQWAPEGAEQKPSITK